MKKEEKRKVSGNGPTGSSTTTEFNHHNCCSLPCDVSCPFLSFSRSPHAPTMPITAEELTASSSSTKLRPALPDDPNKTDDLEYDLGNLMAFDSHPIDPKALHSAQNKELFLRAHARDNAQLLFNRIFQLETVKSDVGMLALLPTPTTPIPRHKPAPKKKPETRWEKFAREKGIKNKKRERMVWDEQKKEWAPRYGYKRANDELRDWAIEVGPTDDPYQDPFQKRRMEKKERILKNKLKQLGNQDRASGRKVPHGLKPNLAAQDQRGSKGSRRNRIGLGQSTNEALVDSQRSSASMGKFDKKLKGEKQPNRGGKRRKKLGVTNTRDESAMARKILDRVLS